MSLEHGTKLDLKSKKATQGSEVKMDIDRCKPCDLRQEDLRVQGSIQGNSRELQVVTILGCKIPPSRAAELSDESLGYDNFNFQATWKNSIEIWGLEARSNFPI